MFHYSLSVIDEQKMSEIRILNLCHKKAILVDIYRQLLLNHNIFLCFDVFGHSLCWSEKIFCLEELGILHSAGMKICILSTFPAYGKVGVA